MKELHIDTVDRVDDFKRCLTIQQETWQFNDIDIVPLHVLITAAHTGGLVLGAWVRNTLVGFVLGFAGRDSEGTPYHHSHMAAVLPAYRNLGIGYALKQEQARRIAQQGVPLIVWTYDPLEARNAYFNLNRLGAVARIYLVNHYGIMGDGLNVGLESDRFQVEQWLGSKRARVQPPGGDRPNSGKWSGPGHLPEVDSAEANVLPAAWQTDLPRPPDAVPTIALSETLVETLVEIPPDFQQIKQRDMGLARAWRHYFRHLCLDAFARGFAAVSLERRSVPSAGAFPDRTFYLFRPLPPGPVP
jgi:predicted GNAT superfamily acetyltransferase